MDTKFFAEALAEYCKKHRLDSKMPITVAVLSELMLRAQELKDAERKRLQDDPPPTPTV